MGYRNSRATPCLQFSFFLTQQIPHCAQNDKGELWHKAAGRAKKPLVSYNGAGQRTASPFVCGVILGC